MLIYLFAIVPGLLPSFGIGGWRHLVLPAATMSCYSLAIIVRMTRSGILEVQYITSARAKGIEELFELLRIPSISTYSHCRDDVRRAAEWIFSHLERIGFQGGIFRTERSPIVYARHCKAPGAPTLLIYGHYGVQPPEPLDEWMSPSFEPVVRGEYVYARGANDDKGQFFTYVKAAEAVLAAAGTLPLNIKFLVEGEEEIGSPSLGKFLLDHKVELRADVAAISDTSQFAKGVPAVTYGLRGISYQQIEVQGPRIDLHSGVFGGLTADPVLVPRDNPNVQAAARAIEIDFGKVPAFIRAGGSIPIVNRLREALAIDSILILGWGCPDNGSHSPNERFSLDDFHNGIRSTAALMYELARVR